VGMFAYYAQWVPCFSEKIKLLIATKEFPLREEALQALKTLKQDLTSAALKVIDEKLPFVLETDASDNAISATLNQQGQPVTVFSSTLNKCELHQSSVEKEACAIVEAIQKWTHLLSGRRFTVVTDQQSVSIMYNVLPQYSKIKNEKIMRWRMQISEFDFEVVFRPGKLNSVPNARSRAYCASLHESTLHTIHSSLRSPGTTRLYHFVRDKNWPYSLAYVRKTVEGCRVCSEAKPNFCKPPSAQLIKATQPLERLSVGPFPSSTKNRYLLTIVDEYSRFPFAFPCASVDSKGGFTQNPVYVSDRQRLTVRFGNRLTCSGRLSHRTRASFRERLTTCSRNTSSSC